MKLLLLADLHDRTIPLAAIAAELAAADAVLLAGDLTHFGGARAAEGVVAAVRRHNPRLYAVAGNCDQPDVEDYLIAEGISLHRRHAVLGKAAPGQIILAGVGGSLPSPAGHAPNEMDEADLADALEAAVEGAPAPAGAPLVLVSHQPPYDTVADLARIGRHVGSCAVRAFIERRQPLVCGTGHIHESRGVGWLGLTLIVSPGAFRDGYYAWLDLGAASPLVELKRV